MNSVQPSRQEPPKPHSCSTVSSPAPSITTVMLAEAGPSSATAPSGPQAAGGSSQEAPAAPGESHGGSSRGASLSGRRVAQPQDRYVLCETCIMAFLLLLQQLCMGLLQQEGPRAAQLLATPLPGQPQKDAPTAPAIIKRMQAGQWPGLPMFSFALWEPGVLAWRCAQMLSPTALAASEGQSSECLPSSSACGGGWQPRGLGLCRDVRSLGAASLWSTWALCMLGSAVCVSCS